MKTKTKTKTRTRTRATKEKQEYAKSKSGSYIVTSSVSKFKKSKTIFSENPAPKKKEVEDLISFLLALYSYQYIYYVNAVLNQQLLLSLFLLLSFPFTTITTTCFVFTAQRA